MCGILGMIGANHLPKGLVNKMILNGYLEQKERGSQSFGALISSNKKSIVTKDVKLDQFFKKFAKAGEKNASFVLFHHRMASVGSVNNANTHPFVAGDICLVHNGTWVHSAKYKSEFIGELQGDTDSEVLGHMINKYGIRDTIENKFSNGSASLVWVDKKDNTLNFWRTSTPMNIAFVPELKLLLFGSTVKAVEVMISILNLNRIAGIFNPYYIVSTEEHNLYTINLKKEGSQYFLSENFEIVKGEKIKPKLDLSLYYSYYNINNNNDDDDSPDNYDCSLPVGYTWNSKANKKSNRRKTTEKEKIPKMPEIWQAGKRI